MSTISVVMPTYNQASFIARAIKSLELQSYSDWELIIINDGSTDKTKEIVQQFLSNHKITYYENPNNKGLGAALNLGLLKATGKYIAYLPSDDIYFQNHLETLLQVLQDTPSAVLAYSGIIHHYNKRAPDGVIPNYPVQLVQLLHKKTNDTWMERSELVTDDLEQMFYCKLRNLGAFVSSKTITATWVDHPNQHHKIIQEPIGGINPYKQYYGVKHPLKYHSTVGNDIDEVSQYQNFREKQFQVNKTSGLKIVLVGELAYNADRVVALAERGHTLYGLWMSQPYWYNTVGPLPFGHVTDISTQHWQQEIKKIKPDVIYALLNWQAVPFAHYVLQNNKDIPFVWHFKEGPFICLEKGTWNQLVDLYTLSDGQIYSSPQMRDWFEQFISTPSGTTHILDGDLPKQEWFTIERSPKLSQSDEEIHTVVPGRPIGLHPETVAELAQYHIHLHFYGDFTQGQWRDWITRTKTLATGYIHIHPNIDQRNWTAEFSQYDAGWLHAFKSENNSELMRANWDDLNYPARMSTLAAAGLPMIQSNNTGHIVATQSLIQKYNMGVFFKDIPDLSQQLHDQQSLRSIQETVWKNRRLFTFDYHADELTNFFHKIINHKKV